ncbi:uncharacterized protein [Epargyreus clarus]|uniref:uncharacterized protein n=1 Tax=Epargyreus clarus TaxID=520877 RepID=UPI003C2BF968
MSLERGRSCTGSAPHVTKRLYATIMFFIGVLCIVGGYLLGRMARGGLSRTNDIVLANLTIAVDNLYQKAKSMTHKTIRHIPSEKITQKLLETFHCTQTECGTIINYKVADFLKNAINFEVSKLLKTIHNASLCLDTFR